jgi:hypothetical protein
MDRPSEDAGRRISHPLLTDAIAKVANAILSAGI